MTAVDVLIATAAFVTSFVLSTLVIRRGIPSLHPSPARPTPDHDKDAAAPAPARLPDSASNAVFDWRATGLWIGFCETFLIFVLVFEGEFGAIAIIIGAKEFVRKEKIQENSSYYLLGTLANLCIAMISAMAARWLMTQV